MPPQCTRLDAEGIRQPADSLKVNSCGFASEDVASGLDVHMRPGRQLPGIPTLSTREFVDAPLDGH